MVTIIFAFRLEGYSRGALAMDGVLLLGSIAASRVSFRLLRTWIARFQQPDSGKRILIYGAGDGGELLLRELQNNRELGLLPVGFVDDDPRKVGRVIHGVRVLGPVVKLQEMVDKKQVAEVVISTSKLEAERDAEVARLCAEAGVHCRRLRIALE
jgi:UDP-GlcNAc:undecaprenyl-phosphate GlcNAc-1-phosphate transferase